MKVRVHSASVAAAFLSVLAAFAEDLPLRVRGVEGRVAIYATTNAVREAVAWVPPETELVVCGQLAEGAVWVRVEPPERVSVWVYRELIRDGAVLSDKVRVRSGAGLNFHPVGVLNKGDRVEVRGTYGDWLRIKPPPALVFWALRDQVEPLAVMPSPESLAAASAATNDLSDIAFSNALFAAAAAVATNAPAATVAPPVAVPAVLAGYALADVPGQGARIVLRGVLDWGMAGTVSTPFCVVAQLANGDSHPICHLLSPASLAHPDVGSSVSVQGTSWRVKGTDLPVVVAEKISPVE